MTPGSFDIKTCREVVGDARTRALEDQARRDALTASFNPPGPRSGDYWTQARARMEHAIYTEAYNIRLARLERKLA